MNVQISQEQLNAAMTNQWPWWKDIAIISQVVSWTGYLLSVALGAPVSPELALGAGAVVGAAQKGVDAARAAGVRKLLEAGRPTGAMTWRVAVAMVIIAGAALLTFTGCNTAVIGPALRRLNFTAETAYVQAALLKIHTEEGVVTLACEAAVNEPHPLACDVATTITVQSFLKDSP